MAIYTTAPIFSELITIPASNTTVFQATALYSNCTSVIIANGDANGSGISNTNAMRLALKSSTSGAAELAAALTDANAAYIDKDLSFNFSFGPASERVGGNTFVFQAIGSPPGDINIYISQICETGQ